MTSRRLVSSAAVLLLAPALLGLSLGCGGRLNSPEVKPKKAADKEDALDAAFQKLNTAGSPSDYWDALRQVSFALESDAAARADLKQEAAGLAALNDRLGLDPEELEEASAPAFRRLDAHHVHFCFQLRDVAHALPVEGLPPLAQAQVVFEWVVRQLLLRGDEGLTPPQFALMRGEGNGHERALLFLDLLRQLDLDGCMIALPGPSPDRPRYWLPGVLVHDKGKSDVYLFDTRLGLPLPGPGGKGVATLAQVRTDPGLLAPLSPDESHRYDVNFEQARQAEAHLVFSLPGVSPRMQYLEERLASRDRVRLAVNPAKLLKRLEDATGGKVGVWNRPGQAGDRSRPLTPARALAQFLPPEEGGVDPGKVPRPLVLKQSLVPWPVVLKNYRDLRVYDELPRDAQERLHLVTDRLFAHYIVTPHEQLARGRFEEATRKLFRIRDAIQEYEEARLPRAVQVSQAAAWRESLKQAYLALIHKQPGARERVEALWSDDQYFLGLLLDNDDEGSSRQGKQQTPEKKALTFLVLGATAEPLSDSARYLLALCWQEKAERAQNRADQAGAAGQAAEAWITAGLYARQYADRYPVTLGAAGKRVRPVLEGWRAGSSLEVTLGQWEQLFRDLRRSAACRLFYANGLREAGKGGEAADYLARVGAELDGLCASAELKSALGECTAATEALPPGAQAHVRGILEPLARELAAGGSLPWMSHSALVQRQLLKRD